MSDAAKEAFKVGGIATLTVLLCFGAYHLMTWLAAISFGVAVVVMALLVGAAATIAVYIGLRQFGG